VFRHDSARTYSEKDGLHPVGVVDIASAPDGAIWVLMRDGVAVLAPGASHFRYLGPEVGLPTVGMFQMFFSRDGATWIGSNTGAYFRQPGQRTFTRAWPRLPMTWLCEAPDGTLWGNDTADGYHRVTTAPPAAGAAAGPELAGYGMYIDAQRTMWMMHADGFERRVSPTGPGLPEQRLSKENGISSPKVYARFQDREGNLWISTALGIDRLRRNRLNTLPVEAQLEYPALVFGPAGDIWVGDYKGDLWSYGPGGRLKRQVEGKITAAYTAPDGVVWLGGMEGVQRRALDGSVTLTPYPDELKSVRVHALQEDGQGDLWVAFSNGRGVWKLSDGIWTKSGGVAGLSDMPVTSMARDHAGDLWMGHTHSLISIVSGAMVRTLGAPDGLELGTIMDVYRDGQGMWAGGENGVALYRGGHFVVLRGMSREQFRGVSGIVRMPGGDLWLHGADGLYHIAAADVAAWLKDPRASVAFERFDAQDGMQGHAPQFRPVPSLKRARDGVLWYATTVSVGSIDPAHILRNRLVPPVEMVSVIADDVHYGDLQARSLSLPGGTRNIEIDFAALSLSIPDRVRIRYRLVGLDSGWQELMGRRQASYTSLAPGTYRFEVMASNEDRLWNEKAATLQIVLAPTFLQSGLFKLLLAVLGLSLLYVAYALRIRFLTQRMQERLQTRLMERSRIARALHDTLLQSIQALLLSFDMLSRNLKEGTQERRRLDQTLNLAETLLVEGREQIIDLRAASSPDALELTLLQFGRGLAEHRLHVFDLQVDGVSRPLRQEVQDEIYSIAREALFNASRYADAKCIDVRLEYASNAFMMQVSDNGQGLDESVAAAGHRAGHWGLVGMRERAEGIGASLVVNSKPGRGTAIIVTLPGKLAY